MPVRIYDIAKRHGISSKEVIEKLVEYRFFKTDQNLKPSSTIDKVTAEELEKLLPTIQPTGGESTQAKQAPQEAQTAVVETPSTQEAAATNISVSPEASTTATETVPVSEATKEPVAVAPADAVASAAPPASVASASDAVVETVVLEPQKSENLAGAELNQTETAPVAAPAEEAVSEKTPETGDIAAQTAVSIETTQESPQTETEKPSPDTAVSTPETAVIETSVSQQETAEPVVEEKADNFIAESVAEQQIKISEERAVQQEAMPEPAKVQAQEQTPVQTAQQPQETVQQPPPPPKQPGIGDVVGRIDISKYLTKDKQKEREREKEKQKQKAQEQKKGGQPQAKQLQQAKQQPQKPAQQAGKVQQVQGKPAAQQKPSQQQSKKAPLTPVQIVKAPITKDGGKAAKIDKPPKLPPDAPTAVIKPPITVRELAEKLNKKPFQIIAELLKRKLMANVNALVDEAVAKDIAAIFGINLIIEKRGAKPVQPPKKAEIEAGEDEKKLKPRPPVVTIMGHVDHGKTTLLDAIRKSNVVATEAGGITQHIGAYTVTIPHPDDKKRMMHITFLDTPGHAAFSAMRARGANVTDIVVLVVAADDGVMPQTIEALNHAKAANVPIIVAVNKCDHPNANPVRVREQLSKQGLTPEEWGGDTIYVDVSALKKQNVDKLLEMIVLKAELMELKANPDCPAKGFVIESALEPGGPAVTLLIKRGTLRVGDVVLCGQFYGKARALINEKNERLKEAGPSFAVKMLGLNGVPEPGQSFEVVKDLEQAREIAEARAEELKLAGQTTVAKKITLETLLQQIEANQAKVLKVVVKADTQGSVEAICGALKNIKSEKVSLEIIHSGVGPVSESDVMLASAAKGIVIGFHTKLEHGVSEIAKREGVQIKLYTIIYELIDEVKKAMAGLLEPIVKEVVTGRADVKKVFELSKGGKVAGCMVREGVISRGKVRVYRGKDLIYDGVVASLRHFQEEVNEIRAGMECGIRIEGFNDFQEGDTIECYTVEKTLQDID